MKYTKKINASVLKWSAMATMFVDHLGIMLAGKGIPVIAYYIMRGIGRLSFPIFCFLLVEGFRHTKSFPKYMVRIGIFAVLSEIPYDFLNCGRIFDPLQNNILFTFCIALLVLYLISKYLGRGTKGIVFSLLIVTAGIAVSYLLKLEYSYKCILISVFFYITGQGIQYTFYRNVAVTAVLLIDSSAVGLAAPLSLFLISGYNGEKGIFPKWFGYAFYPLHLMILGLIGTYIL